MQNIQNTIIHLVAALGEWNFAHAMLNDIASQPIPPHTRVILCLETTPASHRKLIPPGITVPGDPKAEKLTIVYRLVPAANGKSEWEFVSIPEGYFNFRFHCHLTQFFREHIIMANAAERYFLFTWGHGATYAVFPTIILNSSLAGESVTHLSMDHLCRAITDTSTLFRPFKISVIVMINCYMQTMETGYELSLAQTEYLVAPENFGSWEGYNYKEMFKTLFENPAISSKDFATQAVSSLYGYAATVRHSFSPLSKSVISAVNLKKYRELFQLIDQLSVQLLALPKDTVISLFKIVIAPTSIHDTIDLFGFITALRENVNPVFPVVNDFFNLLNSRELVIASFTGNDITYPFKGISIGIYGYGTIAVSPYYARFMYNPSPFASTFTKTNIWGLFTEQHHVTIKKGKKPINGWAFKNLEHYKRSTL